MKILVSSSNKKVLVTTVTFDEHEIREALMTHFAYELQNHSCLGGPDLDLFEGCHEDPKFQQEEKAQFAELIYIKEEYLLDF